MAGDSKGDAAFKRAGAASVGFHSQDGYVKLVKTNDSPISYIPVKERESPDQHASNERRNFELQWFKSKSNYSIELVFKLKSN